MKPRLASVTIVALLFALVIPAHARIGENVKEIEARYGKPQRVLHERGTFREVGYGFSGFMVGVGYIGGVSKREGFARPDLPKLSDGDVQRILAFSADRGLSWKPLSVEHGDRYWTRSDGKVIAMLTSAGNFLTVQDRNFHEPK